MTPLEVMRAAALLGAKASPTDLELSVGCVITDEHDHILTTGYSREDGHQKSHAEKIALEKLPDGTDTSRLKLYSSVEPCGTRLSDNPTCTSLILKSGIRTVYYAMHEPDHFVHQNGLDRLSSEGVTVTHVCDDAIFEMVAKANPHIDWHAH